MKIRQGFVSNSSSASFIVKIKTTLSKEELSNIILKSEDFSDYSNFEFEYAEEIFSMNADTNMFNDWMDVPGWKFIRAISENRIKDVSLNEIVQTSDDYDDLNEKVVFNKDCWEVQDNWSNEPKSQPIDIQNKIELEYIEYLKTINQEISDDELLKLTKYLLSK